MRILFLIVAVLVGACSERHLGAGEGDLAVASSSDLAGSIDQAAALDLAGVMPSVPCAGAVCGADEVCCAPPGPYHCVVAPGGITMQCVNAYACDGVEDCGGALCYGRRADGESFFIASRCATGLSSGEWWQICRSQDECPVGLACVPAEVSGTGAPPFKRCAPVI